MLTWKPPGKLKLRPDFIYKKKNLFVMGDLFMPGVLSQPEFLRRLRLHMLIAAIFLLSCVMPQPGSAETLEASTSMTVINVTDWSGASYLTEDYTIDTLLYNVVYHTGGMSWSTKPYPRLWGQTLPNGVTGNLWAVYPLDAAAKSWRALAWDYIGNTTSSKHCCSDGPPSIVFTMLSSLCDTPTGRCANPPRRRTNLVRWPPIDYGPSALRISPRDAGVFARQDVQHHFQVYGTFDGVEQLLDDSKVDWYITADPYPGQDLKPEEVAEIDDEGNITLLSTYGRVKVSACYPRGCGPDKKVNPGALLLLKRRPVNP